MLAQEAGMQDQVLDVELAPRLIAVPDTLGDDEGIATLDWECVILEVVPTASGGNHVDLDEGVGVHADGVGAMMQDAHRSPWRE